VRELVELVDLMPTVLSLAGLPAPEGLHGIDLGPLMRGEPGARGHEVVYSEYTENEEAMVRTDRYKLIVGSGARLRQDGYATRQPMRRGPYFRLYDERNDPRETHDLAGLLEYNAVREGLLQAMVERMRSSSQGDRAMPPGLATLDAILWRVVPRDAVPERQPSPAALLKKLNRADP